MNNVINARNLYAPAPTRAWTDRLQASLRRFSVPHDPRTVGLLTENWAGNQTTHCIYSVGLGTLQKQGSLEKLVPICWRFMAAQKNSRVATACLATYDDSDLPAKIIGARVGPEMADILDSTTFLNIEAVKQNGNFELRVLRVPALCVEAFWLYSKTGGAKDLIVPYGLLREGADKVKLSGKETLNRHQFYTLETFIATIGKCVGDGLPR